MNRKEVVTKVEVTLQNNCMHHKKCYCIQNKYTFEADIFETIFR